jgi:(p)ppGpp synthase/HD superfamily hydrolase
MVKAIDYAKAAHGNQTRKNSRDPYYYHVISVAMLVVSFKKSRLITNLVVAAILHDVIEDTSKHIDEIRELFGGIVANLVMELTNDKEKMKRMGGKTSYLKDKLVHMSGYAFLIKLCDRLHNMLDKPTQKMLTDTIEILEYVKVNRKKISLTQHEIIEEILTVCRQKLQTD